MSALAGQTAIVTGAGRGIGRAVALALAGLFVALGSPAARGQWNPWTPLGDQKFDAGAGVTALTPRAGQVNLLAVGKDRKVYANTWRKEKGWQAWAALGDLNERDAVGGVALRLDEAAGLGAQLLGDGEPIHPGPTGKECKLTPPVILPSSRPRYRATRN